MPELSSNLRNDRTRERLVLLAVCTTALSLVPTAYAALVSNSVTLIADLLRCVGEFFSILISWLVLRKMSKNERSRFNYGYGKLEQLAALAVAAALFLAFLLSFISGIRGLAFPAQLQGAEFGFVFAVVSVVGNLFLWVSNYLADRRSPSPIAESQWRLFRAKTCATLVVTLSLAGGLFLTDYPISLFIDPVGSLILSLFLLWQSYTILSSSVPNLIDYALEEKLQSALDTLLASHRDLYDKVERIRSRRTPHRIYIELFLSFDPTLSFGSVHARVMLLKRAVASEFPGADITVIPSLPPSSSGDTSSF